MATLAGNEIKQFLVDFRRDKMCERTYFHQILKLLLLFDFSEMPTISLLPSSEQISPACRNLVKKRVFGDF